MGQAPSAGLAFGSYIGRAQFLGRYIWTGFRILGQQSFLIHDQFYFFNSFHGLDSQIRSAFYFAGLADSGIAVHATRLQNRRCNERDYPAIHLNKVRRADLLADCSGIRLCRRCPDGADFSSPGR